jgi:hypothetical protein
MRRAEMGKSAYFILMGIVAAILMFQNGFAEDLQANASDEKFSIATAEEAIRKAIEYTGFPCMKGFIITDMVSGLANPALITDTSTPFIADQIDGRPVWVVKFKNVILSLENVPAEIEADYPKDFDIFLDSVTGLPLKVISGSKEEIYRLPTRQEAEQLLSSTGERYSGIPANPPRISFHEALNRCEKYPVFAKEIIVNYVLYSQVHYTELRPAWVIYLRGLPPLTDRNEIPLQYRTNMRFVIDAETGHGLWRNNLPYPLPKKDKKADAGGSTMKIRNNHRQGD